MQLWRGLCAFVVSVLLWGCSSRVDLLASIAEADANEVIAALINAGIQADKVAGKEGMVGIQVNPAQAARAFDVLRSQGLPREQFAGMGQVFKKDGLISSPLEERARYLYALSQDLSGTLARIDGVLFARVHLVLPQRGPVNEADTPSSAAVFIKHQKDADIAILQPQVRRMVVNSIPDLAPERVSVVLIPSTRPSPTVNSEWVQFLGFRVEPAGAGTLRVVLAIMVVLTLGSLGGAGYLVWQHIVLPRRNAKTGAAAAGKSDASATQAG